MRTKTSAPETPSRKWIYRFVDVVLFAAGVVSLAVGIYKAINDSTAIAATVFTAGFVFLLAATIDRFESLKGLGIEAKTRQLDQKLGQADEALKRLREMTEVLGAALIELNSKTGRWGAAPGRRESIVFGIRMRQMLKELGSDEHVIMNALRPWAETLCGDLAYKLTLDLKTKSQDRLNTIQRTTQPGGQIGDHQSAEIQAIKKFQTSRCSLKLELEDYPDRFMEIFDNVPWLDPLEVANIRDRAARFVPGMVALVETRTLPDADLWIEILDDRTSP